MIGVGTKINSWTYIGVAPSGRKKYGLFRCDCGEVKEVFVSSVVTEKSRSCKHCKWNYFGLSHEDYNSIIYARRRAINRCYNTKYAQYHRYGGRGITVCDEWLESQESFVRWAMASGWKKGLSLDRIDNDKGYSPDNCHWATDAEQARNKSSCIYLEHNGERKCLMDWCKEYGVPHHLPLNRINRGYTRFEDLFSLYDQRNGVMLHY